MKILIVNLHSSLNLGDLAITTQTLRQLQKIFPGAQITLAMNDPYHHTTSAEERVVGSMRSWVWQVDEQGRQRWRAWRLPFLVVNSLWALIAYRRRGQARWLSRNPAYRELLQAYFEADCVISCGGGNIFYTWNWHGFGFWWSMYALIYAVWARKPIYMLPQSIGPFAKRWQRCLASIVLKRMQLIIVREPKSESLALSLGIDPNRCRIVPDLALGLEPHSFDRARQLLTDLNPERSSGPLVGINAMDWARLNRYFTKGAQYESALVDLMRHVVFDLKGSVVLCPQVLGPSKDEDDREISRRLQAVAGLAGRVKMLDQEIEPGLLSAIYSQLDLFIGTRMHSIILAVDAGVPAIAIGYMNKTWGTMQVLGLNDWICDIATVKGPLLRDMVDKALQQHGRLRAHLAGVMPQLRESTWQAGKLIGDNWRTVRRHKSK